MANLPYYYFNNQRLSLTDIAQAVGIDRATLYARLSAHQMQPETDVTDLALHPAYVDIKQQYQYQGELLALKQIAQRVGIAYNTLYRRIQRGGIKPGADITTFCRPKGSRFTENPKKPTPRPGARYRYQEQMLTVKEIAAATSLRPPAIYQLINTHKLSADVDLAPWIKQTQQNKAKMEPKLYVYRNQLLSIAAIARQRGMPYSTTQRRISNSGVATESDVTAIIDRPKGTTYSP